MCLCNKLTEGVDYDPEITTNFNNDMFCATIQVKNDLIDENIEQFFINAQVLGCNDSASATARIRIIDDGELLLFTMDDNRLMVTIVYLTQLLSLCSSSDIPTFVFNQSAYTFGESVGNATVCAMTGTELERTITLNIRTSDKTATGEMNFE